MSVLASGATDAEQLVHSAGYAGLGLAMAAETVLPVPSEVVLPVVGLEVSAGQLLFWAATLAATLGSVLGAAALYALSRWGGRPATLRLPRFLGLTEERLPRTESWFNRYSVAIVLLGRLVPGLRTLVSVPAGTLRMPVRRFLGLTALTALGSPAWNAGLLGAGVLLADRWTTVLAAVSTASPYLLAGAASTALLVVVRPGRPLSTRQ